MSHPAARSATPLVLLHGATSSSRAWETVLPTLRARYDVWAPCLAGHRGGPPLSVSPSQVVMGIVDELSREFDERGIAAAHLVGNSLGGWVALELARRGRAASVLALSPAGAWRSSKDLALLLARFRIGASTRNSTLLHKLIQRPAMRRIIWRVMAEHCDRLTTDEAIDLLDDLVGCATLTDLLAGARAAGPMVAFQEINCPVRIAWAGRDRMLPFSRYGVPFVEAVPGAELMILPTVGHVPMIDDPALVARTILDFVDRVDTFSGGNLRRPS
jgi:pimeloyl-ACP methyl ester carboxylesterase